MANTISITSGSDATIQFAFTDGDGAALTVSNPTLLKAGGGLAGVTTAAVTDGAGGIVTVTIEGTAGIAVGTYALRLQVELSDGSTLASEEVTVNVR